MERVTDIFEEDTETSVEDLDIDLANASHVLQKIAEQEGIDIDTLSDEDVANLLTELLPPEKIASHPQEHQKEETMSTTIPNEITNADVAVELGKIAQAEGIDLNEISREEYHAAFEDLAQRMSDPSYFEEKVASEQRLAEGREFGAAMAEGFVAKLAELEDEETKEASKAGEIAHAVKETLRKKKFEARQALGKAKDRAKEQAGAAVDKAKGAVRGAASAVGDSERAFHGGLGKAMPNRLTRAVAGKLEGSAKDRLERARVLVGRGTTAVVAGGGAAYSASRKKESFDEAFEQDAVAYANHLLIENGIVEPSKVASENTEFSDFAEFAGDEYYAAVEERAAELLQEHGYLD